MPVFKFTCEFLVRAETLEKAENEVKEEMGFDVYENHFLVKEIKDTNQDVDIDLIEEKKGE